jgi:hypothetical protein
MSENESLEEKYNVLLDEHNKLVEEYEKLSHEFNENVIIQSMNDMRDKYNNMIKNTVPLYKYQLISEKYKNLHRTSIGCAVLIDHIIKLLRQSETNRDYKSIILKSEIELITLKDILEDVLE